MQPRSLARWPSRSAMVAHDAQCAAAGVTTVFDALCLGDLGFDKERIRTFHDGVVDLDALSEADLLKAEHFLHLRCEVPALDMLALFDSVADHALMRMVSLMDHSPGVGQYADLDFYRALRRRGGMDDDVYRAPHPRIAGAARADAPAASPGAARTASPAATSRWRATTTGPRQRSPRMPPTASTSASSR